ncbi:MAG: hypothetical protein MI802_26080, partial [Desulfobacterales bacterium]|nr:hypothetical protein [Desulfobacterales bacterium]
MKKNVLMICLSLVVCLAVTQSAWCGSKRVLLKAPLCFATSLPVLGDTIPQLTDDIKTISDGSIVVKYYEPGKLIPPFEILSAVSQGKVNAGFGSPAYWQGKIPAGALFSAIPFGPESDEYMAWIF